MRPETWARWPDFKSRIDRWRAVGVLDFSNGARAVAPASNLATDGYMFWTFAPLESEEIELAEARLGIAMPAGLKAFYGCTNGAVVFSALSIFGHSPEAARDPEAPQPVDLVVENYLRPNDLLVFGAISAWSGQAKLGIRQNDEVLLFTPDRVTDVLKTWPSFDVFLFEEMDRLERHFDAQGRFLGTYAEMLPPEAQRLEFDKTRRPN